MILLKDFFFGLMDITNFWFFIRGARGEVLNESFPLSNQRKLSAKINFFPSTKLLFDDLISEYFHQRNQPEFLMMKANLLQLNFLPIVHKRWSLTNDSSWWKDLVQTKQCHKEMKIYYTIGFHPDLFFQFSPSWLDAIIKLLRGHYEY